VWHWSIAEHVTPLQLSTPAHTPLLQTSFTVAGFPSSQVVPSGWFGFVHLPVEGAHVPATWHWSSGMHVTIMQRFTPLQSPALHTRPGPHVVPSGFVGSEHTPVVGEQVPALWHASSAMHVVIPPLVQTPAWQVFIWEHALASVQPVPSVWFDHADVELDGAHTWHALAGLATPLP
jgi:hypothetical protein